MPDNLRNITPAQPRDPERLDLPSASGFEVDALCPGRNQLFRSLPQVEEVVDEFAERGTRIHRARELMDPSDLDAEDREIYERGIRTEKQIVGQWCQDFGIVDFIEGPREQRIWVHWEDSAQRATSAKLDVQYITTQDDFKRMLVIDWKALWARWVTPAERNYQARVQAVCGRIETDARHVRVAFNKAMFGKADTVDYSEGDLNKALNSIYQALWEMRSPGAQRRPGDHCNYCPCKPWCREAVAYGLLPSVIAQRAQLPEVASPTLEKADVVLMVDAMPVADVARVFTRSAVVVKILEACKARLKKLDDANLQALWLMRDKGRKNDKITSVKQAVDFLLLFGISEGEVWSALQFSKTELVKALMRDQGWSKAAAEGFVDGKLDPFITRDTTEPSLVPLVK